MAYKPSTGKVSRRIEKFKVILSYRAGLRPACLGIFRDLVERWVEGKGLRQRVNWRDG